MSASFVCIELPPTQADVYTAHDFSPIITTFPCGEEQLIFPSKPTHLDTAVIRIDFKADVHRRLYWLWLTVQTLRDRGVKTIEVIAPYLPYQRQQRLHAHTSFGGRNLFRYLNQMALSHLTVMDCHDAQLLHYYQSPYTHITLPELLNTLSCTPSSDVIVTPDRGAYLKLAPHQQTLPTVVSGKKTRYADRPPMVHFERNTHLKQAQKILIVDDIFDSGATLRATLDALQPFSIQQIDIFITHILTPERYVSLRHTYPNIHHLYTAALPRSSVQNRPNIAQIS